MPDRQTVTIIGAGLIGGSLAAALHRASPPRHVVCIDRTEAMPGILKANVADEVVPLAGAAPHIGASKLIVLATPVDVILDLLSDLAPLLAPGTVVTDVGSTKDAICSRAAEVLPKGVHFVGGHPMAGAARGGVAAADPRLFRARPWVLCPSSASGDAAWLGVLDLVEAVGALPLAMAPREHDEVLAMTSHVPQLLAIALFHAAMAADAEHGLLGLLGGGAFRDMTRVAASPWPVWRGILASNREPVRVALDRLQGSLDAVRSALDNDALETLWQPVAAARRALAPDERPPRRRGEFRALVDRCDSDLLAALGERLQAVRRIGALKQEVGAVVLDPVREAQLLARWRTWGRESGVPPELLEPLFATIVGHSRKAQAVPPG